MGHLLGAAPPHPGRSSNRVIDRPQALTEVRVDALRLAAPAPPGIAAFAIDSPRPGDHAFGAGVEITGWAIGAHAAVRHVRPVSNGSPGVRYPLDVRRPDVFADYPDFGHAVASGFTAWAPIDPGASRWSVTLEAIVADGTTASLAEISGGVLRTDERGRARNPSPPDFVIIGAQRAGTTSLHAYLSAHPRVRTPATKELHYLTDRHERGRDWYVGQFPSPLPPGALTGEATPYALFHPLAPERLWRIAPRARLIALLRNPVDRAYSHYLLERSRGFETLDFAAALDAEAGRLAGEEARLRRDATYVSVPHKHFSYLARGDYATQLARWLSVFPREQLLVLQSETLYANTAETFARVAGFLGIAPDIAMPFTIHNRSSGTRLDPAIRGRLRRRFAPSNTRLEALLGWAPAWD